MESSPAQIRRSVPSSRKRGLPRSNPPLMGRVQAECQEQPQAADFQSRLTTNPLPKKQPGSSGDNEADWYCNQRARRCKTNGDARRCTLISAGGSWKVLFFLGTRALQV